MTSTNDVIATPLSVQVEKSVNQYFAKLDGFAASGLHAMVLAEVEKPLLLTVLQHSDFNQTKAAQALGISRSTLRKKLEKYNIS